jgi:class 3 adenylate cyclase
VHYFLAFAYLRTRQPAKAVPRFEEAEKLSANVNEQLLNASFYEQYGAVLEQVGRLDDAALKWEKAIALSSPEDPKAAANIMNSLAYMWVEQGKNLAKAEELLRPGATRHQLTVFFSDIAGFTTVTEGLDPDEFAKLMNQYFETAVGQCVFPTDGTVVKFIGDAIFAIWNAPDPQVDHAWRACEAALRFRSQAILEVKGRPLITRIGLHTGEANVGNFGSRERFDYTAFGESINLASRLEGLNKHLGTLTLLSAVTHAQVEGKFLTRYLGRFVLKGFEKAVEVYELVAKKEDAPQFAELHESFAAGLAAFQSGDREAALMAFEAIAERWPDDGPTQFYLRTLAELGEVTDSGGRAGEVELKEK